MRVASVIKQQISRMSPVRKLVYGFLCIAIAFGIAAKGVFLHRVSQYRKGDERLEQMLQKDERFRDVRIFFYPTRPSVRVLAPSDLPLNARQDLERLITAAFAPLPVPVHFTGENSFGYKDGVSNGVAGRTTNTAAFRPPFADFKRFLSASRPPIKQALVGRGPQPFSKETNFWLLEASLQKGTHYVKEITGIPGSGGRECMIVGASYEDLWLINSRGQAQVTPKNAIVAGTNTPPEIEDEKLLPFVQDILNLGLGSLMDVDTIKWIDSTHLTGSTKPFPPSVGFPSLGEMSGELVGSDPERPEMLKFTFSGRPREKITATYIYNDNPKRPRYIPHYIIHTVEFPHKKSVPITNSIEELVMGAIEGKPHGFQFSEFMTGNKPLTNGDLILYKNGSGTTTFGTNIINVTAGPPRLTWLENLRENNVVVAWIFDTYDHILKWSDPHPEVLQYIGLVAVIFLIVVCVRAIIKRHKSGAAKHP
jgi:hypothetical protein